MTWVSWRLHRTQLLIAGTIAVLTAVAMATTGSPAASLGVHNLQEVAWGVLFALPVVAGIGIGVTATARERERFTNRLAWTQGISRTRWLLSTLAPAAVAGSVAVALVSSVATWWVSAAENRPRIGPDQFDVSGIAPVGYFLGAVALGVLAGAIVRSDSLANPLAAVGVIAARIVVRTEVRPHLAPATHLALQNPSDTVFSPISSYPALEHVWVVSNGWVPVGRTSPLPGHHWYSNYQFGVRCPVVDRSGSAGNFSVHSDCANPAHLHYVVNFQPLSHYWMLQLGETGIFVAGAVAVLGLAVFLLRRSSE